MAVLDTESRVDHDRLWRIRMVALIHLATSIRSIARNAAGDTRESATAPTLRGLLFRQTPLR